MDKQIPSITIGLILLVISCGPDIKVWTEKYPDSEQVKEEYQYYNDSETNRRVKEGWYNSYYPDGSYQEIGRYEGDERVGEWSQFTMDGIETKGTYRDGRRWIGQFWIGVNVESGDWVEVEGDESVSYEPMVVHPGLITYVEGEWNGPFVLYWVPGQKWMEGSRKGRTRTGEWTFYSHEVEVITEKGSYSETGEKDGEWVDYRQGQEVRGVYNDGQRVSGQFWLTVTTKDTTGWIEVEDVPFDHMEVFRGVFSYEDGIRNGPMTVYWSNGKKNREGTYSDGEITGLYKRYYESGSLRSEVSFVDGNREGEVISYHENGKTKARYTFVNDHFEGVGTTFYENGNIKTRYNFVNGKGEGVGTTHHENGRVKTRNHYVNGKAEGERLVYTDTGELWKRYTFRNGILHGPFEEYWWEGHEDQGDIRRKWTYVDGEREGEGLSSFNGKISRRWTFKNDEIQGKVFRYTGGSLTDTDIYEDGVCVSMCEGDETPTYLW